MTDDARFEDGDERPLHLSALDSEDLRVISALVQDAVLPAAETRWDGRRRRLALLINRLRREDPAVAAGRRAPERVQAVLVIDGVLGVASQGVDRSDPDTVLAVLAVAFEPYAAAPPGGAVVVTLAGDGAIRATVEAIDVTLRDVTRPYRAPSGRVPDHGA